MTTRARISTALAFVAALAAPTLAYAEPSAQDTATARKLFEEAAALMNKGEHAAACPKLAAAMKLDKKKGVVINYAVCLENIGKLASAWSYFQEGAAMARAAGDPRAAEAERRAKAIEPKLAKITIEVPAAARGEGLVVKRDGTELDAAVWGTEAPVDPGEHRIEVTRPGYKAWAQTLVVGGKAATVTVTVPALEKLPEEVPKVAVGPVASRLAEEPAKVPFWSGRRIAGVAVGGAGVAGLAIGAALGAMALGKGSDAKAYCSTGDVPACSAEGVGLRGDARSAATASNVAFVVGGAAVVAGVVLFVTAPSSSANAPSGLQVQIGPSVAAGRAGVLFQGAW